MKKRILVMILILMMVGAYSKSGVLMEKATYTITELQKLLKNYSDKYNVSFYEYDTKANYKGKELQRLLTSQTIRGREFEKKYPDSYGINASVAYYLQDLGFKIVKECADSPGHNKMQIGFTWEKDNRFIHYILYSIYEHPSVGSDYTIIFVSEDICGEDYRRGPEKY